MPPPGKRGKYLGFVAHEIKNPLATALWSCDLLKRMGPADRAGERADKMVDVSLRALRRMRRLIDDYFTIERLMEQGYDLKRERITLLQLVEPVLRILEEKDGIATQAWQLELGDAATVGDTEMLRRAVRASLEHMARSSQMPRLSIAARAEGASPAIYIRAESPPQPVIPPDPEERPSGDPAGAVLGFALAARILACHDGRLEEREGGLLLVLPPAA
ncbi:MAG TPA: histidine kinase dimerization/phospho-acceptor domain-containing protein [Myxococcales bacterium]|nr:histidine kinase dimerization/phospho-acceptor domain-containing protein [Myxococcales bacterium]